MELSKKQTIGLDYLQDDETTEVLFGGGAGGGKSVLGCYWILKCILLYDGCRCLIGRSELKTLKETTLVTFFEVCKMQGLKEGAHYRYNSVDSYIKFYNGSMVLLKDLKFYPKDPNFDSLGSLEVTAVFIDEVAQIIRKAWGICKSRIRYKLDKWDIHGEKTCDMKVIEYDKNNQPVKWLNSKGEETRGLLPKIFGSCNPNKGFAYVLFYKPTQQNDLPKKRKFVQSLVYDNPRISAQYIENLKELDLSDRARLLDGKWEYEEHEDQLISYASITDYFTNSFVEENKENKRITVDVARKGKDKSIVRLWYGYACVKRISIDKCLITELAIIVKDLSKKEGVPMSSIIADEDGVGGGLVDILKCRGFIGNSRPFQVTRMKQFGKEDLKGSNFVNLKAQCTYLIASMIEGKKLSEITDDHTLIELLTEEMEWVRSKDKDKDGKKRILGKDIIKKEINRSPDDWDSIMMLGFFELVPKFFVS